MLRRAGESHPDDKFRPSWPWLIVDVVAARQVRGYPRPRTRSDEALDRKPQGDEGRQVLAGRIGLDGCPATEDGDCDEEDAERDQFGGDVVDVLPYGVLHPSISITLTARCQIRAGTSP